MHTRVYKYGARFCGDERVLEQMRLGRHYYNQLVEAENERRRKVWGGDSPPAPPHDDCKCVECRAHWADIRKRMREEPPLDVKPLRAKAAAEGLYWGTYLVIEQAFAAAWKKTTALHTVRFRSWRQGDVIAVQIQAARRHSLSSFFRLEKTPDPRQGRRARDGRGRHTVEVRIGSDDKRKPVFSAPIRIELHRPMEGDVTWIHVRRKWIADRAIWSVAFTCANCPERTDESKEGTVAVDVSWRKLPDGSWRLGYAQDAAGRVSQLIMPPTWTERSARADRIRSHRDERLNELKALDSRFARCKSCLGVIRAAKKQEIDSVLIREWIARDNHLWRYEVGCRRRSAAGRRDALAKWVRELRRQYEHVIVKDSSHKVLKELHELPQPAQRQGQHAAPGETVEALRRVFGDAGMWVVPAPNTTAQCIECGHITPVNGERMIRCERCGASNDCDDISTRNMMALYQGGEAKKPTARKATARFAKRHAKSEEPQQCQPDGS